MYVLVNSWIIGQCNINMLIAFNSRNSLNPNMPWIFVLISNPKSHHITSHLFCKILNFLSRQVVHSVMLSIFIMTRRRKITLSYYRVNRFGEVVLNTVIEIFDKISNFAFIPRTWKRITMKFRTEIYHIDLKFCNYG